MVKYIIILNVLKQSEISEEKESSVMKKKKIWKRILIIILLIPVVFLGISLATIRFFTGDTLTFKGTLAMAGYGGINFPAWFRNFVLDVDRSYPGLPDLLTFHDGTPVTNEEEYALRREELLADYKQYMFGDVPSEGYEMSYEVLESGEYLDGKAARTQVKATVTTALGSLSTTLLIYEPKTSSHGMFVGMDFQGNPGVAEDPAILPADSKRRGAEAESWPLDLIIEDGWGIITSSYTEWQMDSEDDGTKLLGLFKNDNNTYTAFSAWAFGMSRMVDYLETMENVDLTKIVSVGHSRLARVSLWAAANDQRFTMATASCPGGMERSDISGKISSSSGSNQWVTPGYLSYEGRDNDLPVDTHMLDALIADRPFFLSMGLNDLAGDPIAAYDALTFAKVVWKDIYGIEVIPDGPWENLQPDVPVYSDGVAVYMHSGGHQLTRKDWKCYLTYADQVLN